MFDCDEYEPVPGDASGGVVASGVGAAYEGLYADVGADAGYC